VFSDHRFRKRRGPVMYVGQLSDAHRVIADDLFRNVAELEVGALLNDAGVAEPSAGVNQDLLAAERHERRPAERLFGDVSDSRRPRDLGKPLGDGETGLDLAAGTVDFN